MDGHKYEYQCAKLLKKSGFSRVKVTQGSGDQGIDVIAYKNGKKYGIQCKYYSSPVGNKAVQEAYAGARYYDCDIAVVMTNNTFTKSAIELANKTFVILWENNKVPFCGSSANEFRITKIIGLFICAFSMLGLIMGRIMENIPHLFLQNAQMILLLIGGLFNIFDFDKWKIEFISFIAYLLSLTVSLVIGMLLNRKISYTSILVFIVLLFTFLRMNNLRKNQSKEENSL